MEDSILGQRRQTRWLAAITLNVFGQATPGRRLFRLDTSLDWPGGFSALQSRKALSPFELVETRIIRGWLSKCCVQLRRERSLQNSRLRSVPNETNDIVEEYRIMLAADNRAVFANDDRTHYRGSLHGQRRFRAAECANGCDPVAQRPG